ncbi:hypothetical protein EPA93_22330 [Ktedonosporobacter rubrisoli]|uniref:Uncharacterized protein n=1 Tax=Ktedonosporobacter rubrisoli TaxID=2509675 RepID=A0A4V0YZ59_KTERU|nr:hypothetical protein [Ktedonosporobacter rubrisoli]QBD78581.1 hypothetical protein EPA93_22330 [Ktedonosporobacter rubrisoli]
MATPIPTVPPYRCGAWASTNVPGTYSTIKIYAKLTKNVAAVSGIRATAVAHFQGGDVALDQQPTSDHGGYVIFTLPLAGRQPRLASTTVDVTFQVNNEKVTCAAFFAPQ